MEKIKEKQENSKNVYFLYFSYIKLKNMFFLEFSYYSYYFPIPFKGKC